MTNENLHMLNFDQLCRKLQTSRNGLTKAMAKERLNLNGKNKFTMPKKPESRNIRFWRNCFYNFGILLFLCTVFCFILYAMELSDPNDKDINYEYLIAGCIMLAFFLLSGYLRYLQENDDYGVSLAFKDLMPMYCTVLRNGKKEIVRSENVVLGDILLINYGERIAADVLIFVSNDLEVNNVALTGVSIPVVISPHLTHKDKWIAGNVGFACSHVMKGHGLGIVIACGNDSEVGIMARLSMGPRPLTRTRKHYQQMTVYASIVTILMVFFILCSISLEVEREMIIEFNIGLTIAFIPIYLPTLIYFGLWHTKNILMESGCYVRNMEAASTLGLTSVICSTLIGTLTMRNWQVSEVFVDGILMNVQFLGLSAFSNSFLDLIRVSVLCNDADTSPGQRGVPRMRQSLYGSEYDKAVFQFAMKIIPDIQQLRQKYEILANKPYNKVDRMQVIVLKKLNDDGDIEYVLLMKGYYNVVYSYCTTYTVNNEQVEFVESLQASIADVERQLKLSGRHVNAFAYKVLDQQDHRIRSLVSKGLNTNDSEIFKNFMSIFGNSLQLLGLIAMYDPPSYNVKEAVDRCRSAGIKLVLLTRTDVVHSRAVARTVGIIGEESETIEDVAIRLNIPESQVKRSMITAAVIDMKNWQKKLHHQRWDTKQLLLAHVDLVFADIAVEQRHMIVEVCETLGAIVTVIGHSVHDTSAIRRGHVGVAESTSSQASQSCADIILLDDNFVTLVNSIEQSRLLFENLKKALVYALSSHMAMIMVHVCFLLLSFPFRLFLIESLVLDIFVNMLPALALFYEPPEYDLMKQKPKVHDDYLINRRIFFVAFMQVGIIEASAVFITYIAYMSFNGFLPRDLVGLSLTWYDDSANDINDSYGQEWSRNARHQLEYQTSSVALMTFVIMQCINLILTKTGRASLLVHGFRNIYLNLAVIYLIFIGIILTFLNSPNYLRIVPVDYSILLFYIWPFVILLFLFETGRRFVLRHFPGSWLENETYYG